MTMFNRPSVGVMWGESDMSLALDETDVTFLRSSVAPSLLSKRSALKFRFRHPEVFAFVTSFDHATRFIRLRLATEKA